MVLYEMTFPPFVTKAERYSVLDRPRHNSPLEIQPGISSALHSLIVRMLDLDPAKRPSAEEARAEVARVLEGRRMLVIQLDQNVSFDR